MTFDKILRFKTKCIMKRQWISGQQVVTKRRRKKKRGAADSDSKYLLKPDQFYCKWDAVRVMSKGQETGAA